MATILKVAMLVVLLGGCAFAQDLSSFPTSVGRKVNLMGPLSGPGKAGFYVSSAGGQVYLSDFRNTESIRLGTIVIVTGKLQHFVASSEACAEREDRPSACQASYYFIDGAEVRVARDNSFKSNPLRGSP
jgi:hypothetical protein